MAKRKGDPDPSGAVAAMSDCGPHAPTIDAFLGGRFSLVQPGAGFRCGSDALFLAATVPADASGLVVDLGCGPGAVGFCVAVRAPSTDVALVDANPEVIAGVNASRALPANDAVAARVSAVLGDVRDRPETWQPTITSGKAAYVLMNPPFFAATSHRPARDAGRRLARTRQNGEADLADWFRAARRLAAPDGRLAVVMPAAALGEVLASIAKGFGAVTVHPLRPHPLADASLVIVTAMRDRKKPLAVAPGLVLHEGTDGAFSPAADAVLRQGAPFPGEVWR